MVRRGVWIAALIGMLSSNAVAAKDPETETLTRSGKWVVDYGRDACHIYAEFGTGNAQVVARFTRYAPNDTFVLTLAGKRLGTSAVHDVVKVDFGLAPPTEERVMTGTAGTLPAVFFGGMRIDGLRGNAGQQLPRITPEQEAAATGFTIDMRMKQPLRFETGPLGKVFEVMRDCEQKLVTGWGYDPAVQARLARRVTPIGSPSEWVTDNDYPTAALRRGMSGIVQFRLDVDVDGKVTDCRILERTEPDDFASATCALLRRRAAFDPALDAERKPVRSFFVSRFNWVTGIRSPRMMPTPGRRR